MHDRRRSTGALPRALAAALGLAAAPLGAQEAAAPAATAPPTRWRGTVEASGNVLFGAARQRLVAGALGAARADSALAVRVELQGAYGEAPDADSDVRRVVARNTRLSVGVDQAPHARVSTFGFGTAESSLQQRLAWRVSAGAGAKLTLWQPPAARAVASFPQEVSVSAALLAERTRALPDARPDAAAGAGERVRWSLRARVRRRVGEGLRITHQTLYQPTAAQPARYTVETTTGLASPLLARLELTTSLRDRFDSEARRRGARSNHDGQLLFGVRATF